MKTKIKYHLEVKSQWDKVWDSDSIERNHAKLDYPEYWDIFDRYIHKDKKIIEAGFGLGKWLNYFQSRGYNITGIDYSEVALKKLNEYDDSFNIHQADVTKTPFPDNEFDIYLSFGVLEHLEDDSVLRQAIDEMHRILKKDGMAFITIPNLNIMNYLYSLTNKLVNTNLLRRIFGKKPVESFFFEYNYTEKEFLSYFNPEMFEICEVVPENVPLILKRFKWLNNPSKAIKFDNNLNKTGRKIHSRILGLPNNSFLRKQFSHLLIYLIKKR